MKKEKDITYYINDYKNFEENTRNYISKLNVRLNSLRLLSGGFVLGTTVLAGSAVFYDSTLWKFLPYTVIGGFVVDGIATKTRKNIEFSDYHLSEAIHERLELEKQISSNKTKSL